MVIRIGALRGCRRKDSQTHRPAKCYDTRSMSKHHDGPEAHLLHACGPGLDEQVGAIVQVPHELATT